MTIVAKYATLVAVSTAQERTIAMSATKIGANDCCTDKSVTSVDPGDDGKGFYCLMCGSTYKRSATRALEVVDRKPYSPFAGLAFAARQP